MPLVEDVPTRFGENLEISTHVDIAVAWVTLVPALDLLEQAVGEYDVSLRIIVGTHGNATDPDALKRLAEVGELRLVPHVGPLFHPKIYIFRGEEKSLAWIGSANFTRGGFEENVEAVFETKQCKSVSRWFECLWDECGQLPANAIEKYRRRRRINPPSRPFREMMGKPMRDPDDRLEYLDQARDWSGYVNALAQCHSWWEDRMRGWTVYNATCSWTHTIEQLMPIATMEYWSGLDRNEVRRLLGRYDDNLNSGLLGTMRPMSINVFLKDNNVRQRLKDAVNEVVNAHPAEFPSVAVGAVKSIISKENEKMGIGMATRLLALARPDRMVSLNGASREGLARIFPGVDRLATPDDYGRFLERLYEEPWFDSAEPGAEFEKMLWSMRAALLDCFVYRT